MMGVITMPWKRLGLHTLVPLTVFLLNIIDVGRGRAPLPLRTDTSAAASDPATTMYDEQELPAHKQTIIRGGPMPGVGGQFQPVPGPSGQFQPVPSDENEYVLDLNQLSGDPVNLMAHIKHLASALNTCGFHGQLQQLRLHHLSNRSITCNDGTQAGYYLRKSYGSRKWLIFLEGGWYCFDTDSCRNRYTSSSRLMSSRGWPQTMTGTGIMSADPEENPIWWRSNVVFIPYCSSDAWSGTATASETGGYAFMGALILQQVLQDIMSEGLLEAKQMVLAGSSAGGTGVLINLDRIVNLMEEWGSSARVVGLADSGWFLDTEQGNTNADCTHDLLCKPALTLQRGTKLWNSEVPTSCLATYSEKWKCFYGFRVHETLKTPVFIFQWLFDEVQLTVNMQGPPNDLRQWHFMQKIARQMRASLRNATTVFAPACYAHIVLTRSDWSTIKVRNVKLYKSLQCWLKSHELPRESAGSVDASSRPAKQPEVIPTSAPLPISRRTDQPSYHDLIEETTRRTTTESAAAMTTERRRPRKQRRRGGKKRRKPKTTNIPGQLIEGIDEEDEIPVASTTSSLKSTSGGGRNKNRGGGGGGGRGRREEREATSPADRLLIQGSLAAEIGSSGATSSDNSRRGSGKKCVSRLVDHATCPHCNPTCPKMMNPFTGEGMDFPSFMRLFFGLDVNDLTKHQGGVDESVLDLDLVDPTTGLRVISPPRRRKKN